MAKRLLSKDYNKFVFDTFSMPEKDYFNYYSNIVDENYKYNPDIIEKLKFAINGWIEWYKTKIDYRPVWEVDKNGNKTKLDPTKTRIPLYVEFGIQRHVDKSFFDEQLKIIKLIGGNINLKNRILELESKYPPELRKLIKDIPFPDGFEYSELKQRFEIISELPDIFKTEYKKVIEAKKNEMLKNSVKANLRGFKSDLESQQVEALFEQLKGSYIDKNTNLEHFKAIFKDEPLPNNCKIIWLSTNVLLAYIVKKLFHNDNYLNVWTKAEGIFTNKENKPILNLRKSESNSPFPKRHEKIDFIIKNMDTPLP